MLSILRVNAQFTRDILWVYSRPLLSTWSSSCLEFHTTHICRIHFFSNWIFEVCYFVDKRRQNELTSIKRLNELILFFIYWKICHETVNNSELLSYWWKLFPLHNKLKRAYCRLFVVDVQDGPCPIDTNTDLHAEMNKSITAQFYRREMTIQFDRGYKYHRKEKVNIFCLEIFYL